MNFTPKEAKKIVAANEEWNTAPKSFAAFMNQKIFGDQVDRYATGPTWGRWSNQAKEFLEIYNKAVQEEVQRRLDEGVPLVTINSHGDDSGQSDVSDADIADGYNYETD